MTEHGQLAEPFSRDAVVTTLAAAFLDDPLMGWVFVDAAARPGQLVHWWAWMLDHLPGHAEVLATADDRSAALWYGPDPVDEDAQRDFLAMLSGLLGEAQAFEKLRGLSVIPAAHPHEVRHWYLAAVGTRPESQGQASAARVLVPVLARADAAGIGTYLESSNERNLSFYERLGFVATGRIQVPGGPALIPMWRAPAPPRADRDGASRSEP